MGIAFIPSPRRHFICLRRDIQARINGTNREDPKIILLGVGGVLLHHDTWEVLAGVAALLDGLHHQGYRFYMTSDRPADFWQNTVIPRLGCKWKNTHLPASSRTSAIKMICDEEARQDGHIERKRILVVDDKGQNLCDAWNAGARVCGMFGSGHHQDLRRECFRHDPPWPLAEKAQDLAAYLGVNLEEE